MRKRDLADALTTLAADEVGAGRCADAAARAERSSGILEAMLQGDSSAVTTVTLLETLGTLGDADLCLGKAREARTALERAGALYAKSADQKLDSFAEAMDGIGPLLALAQLADHAPLVALATAHDTVARAETRLKAAPGEYPGLEAVGEAQMANGDVLTARHDAGNVAAYRAAHDAFVQRTKVSRNPLTDPVTTAEAAVKLARLVPRDEARPLLDEAVASLESLERAHRLVPRGESALRDARAQRERAP
jgi:hypothetical protein